MVMVVTAMVKTNAHALMSLCGAAEDVNAAVRECKKRARSFVSWIFIGDPHTAPAETGIFFSYGNLPWRLRR